MLSNLHGVMFHELNKSHECVERSINFNQFLNIVRKIEINSQFVDINDLFDSSTNKLNSSGNKCVITFDDGLISHFECAIVWLEKVELKGVFFIHTQPIVDGFDKLETIKAFSKLSFSSQNEFYEHFEDEFKSFFPDLASSSFLPASFLAEYPFYSDMDRRYRYLRDIILEPKQYFQIIEKMMKNKNLNYMDFVDKKIWMNMDHIREISRMGHMIGLHSHSHPTNLKRLNYNDQFSEFKVNKEILESILNKKIRVASYPCGRYDNNTLRVMRDLDIEMAFKSSMVEDLNQVNLKIPREDCVNILSQC